VGGAKGQSRNRVSRLGECSCTVLRLDMSCPAPTHDYHTACEVESHSLTPLNSP
jgi:hypothetical protein